MTTVVTHTRAPGNVLSSMGHLTHLRKLGVCPRTPQNGAVPFLPSAFQRAQDLVMFGWWCEQNLPALSTMLWETVARRPSPVV